MIQLWRGSLFKTALGKWLHCGYLVFFWETFLYSAGDSVDKLCWGFLMMNSAGGYKELRWGMIFQLQLAEDNPVRLWWG